MSATFEHLVRRCEGGSWDINNLRLAHRSCNDERNRADRKEENHHMNSQHTDRQIRAEVANFRTAVMLQEAELQGIERGCPNSMGAGASLACMKVAVALMEKVLSGGLSARTRQLLIAAVNDVHAELDAGHFKGLLYAGQGTDQDTALPSDGVPQARINDDAVLPDPLPACASQAA